MRGRRDHAPQLDDTAGLEAGLPGDLCLVGVNPWRSRRSCSDEGASRKTRSQRGPLHQPELQATSAIRLTVEATQAAQAAESDKPKVVPAVEHARASSRTAAANKSSPADAKPSPASQIPGCGAQPQTPGTERASARSEPTGRAEPAAVITEPAAGCAEPTAGAELLPVANLARRKEAGSQELRSWACHTSSPSSRGFP